MPLDASGNLPAQTEPYGIAAGHVADFACFLHILKHYVVVFNLESGYLGWIENGYEIVR